MNENRTDVVLVTIPNNMNKVLGWGAKFVTPMAPLGLMYMLSSLRKANISCAILDSFALGYGVKETVDYIGRVKAKVVGLSILTSQASVACEIIKLLRQKYPDVKIVLGNQHADIFAEWFLSKGLADVVVHGEGEETFKEFCKQYLNGGRIEEVKGISAILDNGNIYRTPERPLLQDLDKIPLPSWDAVPYYLYRLPFYTHPKAVSPKTFKNIFTSRGCPYKCIFCTVHHNREVRYHSTPRVIEELNILTRDMGARFIFFMDSLFTIKPARVVEVCEGIIDSGLKFEWGCEGRVDFADRYLDVLKLMRRAGCVQIAYGIESGDQNILDGIGKMTTLSEIEKGVLNTRKAGIEPIGLFMLGLPGDTNETMRKTLEVSKRLPFAYAQFAITVPFPGTKLFYDLVEEEKIDQYDWGSFSQYGAFSDTKAVYTPEGLSVADVYSWQKKAIRGYYLRYQPILRTFRNVRFNMIPEIFYSGLMLTSSLFTLPKKRPNDK